MDKDENKSLPVGNDDNDNNYADLEEEDSESLDDDIDIYEAINDPDEEDDYEDGHAKANQNMTSDDDDDEDDDPSDSENDFDERSPFDDYGGFDSYDSDPDSGIDEEDVELNSVEEEDISDDDAEAAINSQYIDDANECLRLCGLEPCAAEWVNMSLDKRQEITKQLAAVRDSNPDDKQLVNASGNALFFLNIKFFLRVCHRKVQKHSSGGQDYQDKVQSALADIWEFCSGHWLTYDPERATYTTYMSPAKWKVTGFAVGSTTERLSDQTANKFAQIRKAENEIARETGNEDVDDLALQLKTKFPQKVISDYRAWCKSLKSKQLDENMPASKGQLERAEYMRNPEEVVAERNQRELVLSRIMALFPDMDETDLEIIKLKIGFQTTANTESIASMLDIDKDRVSALWNKVRTKLQKDREISILVSPGKSPIKQTLTSNMLMSIDDKTLGIIQEDEEIVLDDNVTLNFGSPENNSSETGFVVVDEDDLGDFGINGAKPIQTILLEDRQNKTNGSDKSDNSTGDSSNPSPKRRPGRPVKTAQRDTADPVSEDPEATDSKANDDHNNPPINPVINDTAKDFSEAGEEPAVKPAAKKKGGRKRNKAENSTIFEILKDNPEPDN